MKVFISIDLEGITGVCAEAQTDPGTPQYATACELMRADLDAALEGCLTAGAHTILARTSPAGACRRRCGWRRATLSTVMPTLA
jgi:D-amino peptidase